MTPNDPAASPATIESFWDFSLRTYTKAGVADACLKLQDEHGLDVNLLLYCCWLGGAQRALDPGQLQRALEFSRPWAENVVAPLRHARRWLKHDRDDLLATETRSSVREKLKALELECERRQQHALEDLSRRFTGTDARGESSVTTMIGNLKRYIEAAGKSADIEPLAVIVGGSAGTAADEHMLTALRTAFPVSE